MIFVFLTATLFMTWLIRLGWRYVLTRLTTIQAYHKIIVANTLSIGLIVIIGGFGFASKQEVFNPLLPLLLYGAPQLFWLIWDVVRYRAAVKQHLP